MAGENGIITVEALYSFKGKNNDELCFNKGDVITVTQREDGGWWEGTLTDKTGWFPSNYVKECKTPDECPASPRSDGEPGSPQHSQQQQTYRAMVLRDILDSERSHLTELQTLLNTHLTALRQGDVLTDAEYKQLVGNLEEVVTAHSNLLSALVEQEQRGVKEQRIGGVFLTMAPQLQAAHKGYCSNHPRAVCILEKYKDELSNFMECRGTNRPGVMFLTAGLSKPFRRLDRYATMLQEYDRHLDQGHPDRGDTQRSAHVYKELASSCSAIRRQKELELEVVTGRVHGWEGGESLGVLGEVVHMGSVALLPDHRDRYLVLFPTTLVTLAVSPRMTAFIFQGSQALSTIHVSKLEDTDHYKNAFEVSGPGMDRMMAVCQTRQDQQAWVELLSSQCRTHQSSITSRPTHHHSLSSPPPPLPPAHVSVAASGTLEPDGLLYPLHSFCSLAVSPRLRPAPPPPSFSVHKSSNIPQSHSSHPHASSHVPQSLSFHHPHHSSSVSSSPHSPPPRFPLSHSQPALCMSCGLPCYDAVGKNSIGVVRNENDKRQKRNDNDGGGTYMVERDEYHPAFRPAPSPSKYYLSRPYAILTKYFSNMYRRKVITRRLLRELAGESLDEDISQMVRLRRHRAEVTINTGGGSSVEESDSDDGKMEGYDRPRGKQRESLNSSISSDEEEEGSSKLRKKRNSSTSTSSSDTGGYWVGGGPSSKLGVGSPVPVRKQYTKEDPSSFGRLHKWGVRQLDSSPSTSEESGVSTDSSNPYGYIRYFSNTEDPRPPISPHPAEDHTTRRFTYTRSTAVTPQEPFNTSATEERSCSCAEMYYCLPHGHWSPASPHSPASHSDPSLTHLAPDSSQVAAGKGSSEELKIHSGITPKYQIFRVDSPDQQDRRHLNPHPTTGLTLTTSRSMPVVGPGENEVRDSGPAQARTVHSATLTIPAAPMVVTDMIDSECGSETSSRNVCDRTIYGASTTSEDDLLGLERSGSETPAGRITFPFKTRGNLAYYVSSCSGDETGEDRADFYENQRRLAPLALPLSRSEPDLWQRGLENSQNQDPPQYSSHLVCVVHSVEGPGLCSCESHSHRSSDSGLADVLNHLEGCPLRDTVGLGRGSSVSHCSHSSQLSATRWSPRSASSCQIRPFTPDPPTDGDSLLLTPVTTPNTSAPVSYTEDSFNSLLSSASLCRFQSPRGGGRGGEAVYRSGLYAHWWMKASVCPRMLTLDRGRKDHLRFKLDYKPDVPPKPRCIKPSYHVCRGRAKGGIVKPSARTTSTQTIPNLPQQTLHPQSSQTSTQKNPSGSMTLEAPSSHLRPKLSHLSASTGQTNPSMSRDRSFESEASQMSQVTVVARRLPDPLTHHPRPGLGSLRIVGSQGSSETSGGELASLHSFSESCERPCRQAHLMDSSEGLDVDFQRRVSSHSLHTPMHLQLPTLAFHSPHTHSRLTHAGFPTPYTRCLQIHALYWHLHQPSLEPSASVPIIPPRLCNPH